jgi:hypothetical protein
VGESLFSTIKNKEWLFREKVLFVSEQFQREPGSESTSLISTLPGAAGAGTREPATGGGIGEAHP